MYISMISGRVPCVSYLGPRLKVGRDTAPCVSSLGPRIEVQDKRQTIAAVCCQFHVSLGEVRGTRPEGEVIDKGFHSKSYCMLQKKYLKK